MAKESKHARTSELSRHLCDLMLASLPAESAPTRKFTATWCGTHILERKSALYWVPHSRNHVQVFLRCEDTPEIRGQINRLLPEGVTLNARPYPRAANWAISTPIFLFIRTEEQARGMGPALRHLSCNHLDPGRSSNRAATQYWTPNSENGDAQFNAAEEGAKITVLINRYERSQKNRRLCIKAHGALCSVCGFDFLGTYGEIGKGYIHVHHLTPLGAGGGRSLKIDPVKDLRPVCPKCHEMLHQCDPPYTIEQLKEIMISAKAGPLGTQTASATG